ncbi:plasmid partitioning protein RepB (plasmid) [Leisingera sp. M527]|uniref:plasmid partitioning protein RepB n=1 Tax=Leisingera sp. M527 TaxID=2867014 RepID=UPI0021A53A73|nr:plasmid partitioning protein RepB [Leisingera sp. M527]UWQ35711.1 plasmid partitioning protein RepB [Leisingera sp. M527]
MTSSKKSRLSMLDSLAAAGAPSPAPASSMMTSNRALRSARDAVDSHRVWDLEPHQIEDTRITDRLDPEDIIDLRDAIETNGQTVPVLVRRHPSEPDRYLLVYGRRRLEAIRSSDKVAKVRALVANLDDDAAVRAQISENMARRDLTFIEKALFALELVENGFGNQSQVAEVLTVTKSSVSMAIAIAEAITPGLARAIGPAQGIGRPRWDALARAIDETGADRNALAQTAERVYTDFAISAVTDDGTNSAPADPSVMAFEAVFKAAVPAPAPQAAKPPAKPAPAAQKLTIGGKRSATLRRSAKGVNLELASGDFADWFEAEAQTLIQELHDRWQNRSEG